MNRMRPRAVAGFLKILCLNLLTFHTSEMSECGDVSHSMNLEIVAYVVSSTSKLKS